MTTTKSNHPSTIHTYVFLEGRCEEAIEFYKRALGAEVLMMMRFKESPEPPQPGTQPPGSENKIMHATVKVGDTTLLMSDGRCSGKPDFQGFSLVIYGADATEAEKLFAALAEGGQVRMPLTKTFFSPRFGMVADRFGVPWMVITRA